MSTGISPTLTVIAGGRFTSLSAVNNGHRQIEDLADYLRRVRNEKGMSQRDVEIKSGNRISKGYIGQIENREVLGHSVTPQKLQALAVGLGISEDEIFAVARGKSPNEPDIEKEKVWQVYSELSERYRPVALDLISVLLQHDRAESRTNPTKSPESAVPKQGKREEIFPAQVASPLHPSGWETQPGPGREGEKPIFSASKKGKKSQPEKKSRQA
jgi:transcriptional regulator with XRE-family HTH domain